MASDNSLRALRNDWRAQLAGWERKSRESAEDWERREYDVRADQLGSCLDDLDDLIAALNQEPGK